MENEKPVQKSYQKMNSKPKNTSNSKAIDVESNAALDGIKFATDKKEPAVVIINKRIRKYIKKLKQIEAVEEKEKLGIQPSAEQMYILKNKLKTQQLLKDLQEIKRTSYSEEEEKLNFLQTNIQSLSPLILYGAASFFFHNLYLNENHDSTNSSHLNENEETTPNKFSKDCITNLNEAFKKLCGIQEVTAECQTQRRINFDSDLNSSLKSSSDFLMEILKDPKISVLEEFYKKIDSTNLTPLNLQIDHFLNFIKEYNITDFAINRYPIKKVDFGVQTSPIEDNWGNTKFISSSTFSNTESICKTKYDEFYQKPYSHLGIEPIGTRSWPSINAIIPPIHFGSVGSPPYIVVKDYGTDIYEISPFSLGPKELYIMGTVFCTLDINSINNLSNIKVQEDLQVPNMSFSNLDNSNSLNISTAPERHEITPTIITESIQNSSDKFILNTPSDNFMNHEINQDSNFTEHKTPQLMEMNNTFIMKPSFQNPNVFFQNNDLSKNSSFPINFMVPPVFSSYNHLLIAPSPQKSEGSNPSNLIPRPSQPIQIDHDNSNFLLKIDPHTNNIDNLNEPSRLDTHTNGQSVSHEPIISSHQVSYNNLSKKPNDTSQFEFKHSNLSNNMEHVSVISHTFTHAITQPSTEKKKNGEIFDTVTPFNPSITPNNEPHQNLIQVPFQNELYISTDTNSNNQLTPFNNTKTNDLITLAKTYNENLNIRPIDEGSLKNNLNTDNNLSRHNNYIDQQNRASFNTLHNNFIDTSITNFEQTTKAHFPLNNSVNPSQVYNNINHHNYQHPFIYATTDQQLYSCPPSTNYITQPIDTHAPSANFLSIDNLSYNSFLHQTDNSQGTIPIYASHLVTPSHAHNLYHHDFSLQPSNSYYISQTIPFNAHTISTSVTPKPNPQVITNEPVANSSSNSHYLAVPSETEIPQSLSYEQSDQTNNVKQTHLSSSSPEINRTKLHIDKSSYQLLHIGTPEDPLKTNSFYTNQKQHLHHSQTPIDDQTLNHNNYTISNLKAETPLNKSEINNYNLHLKNDSNTNDTNIGKAMSMVPPEMKKETINTIPVTADFSYTEPKQHRSSLGRGKHFPNKIKRSTSSSHRGHPIGYSEPTSHTHIAYIPPSANLYSRGNWAFRAS